MSDVADQVIDYANPRAQRPLDSRVVAEEHDDGVSYTFLPEGLGGAVRALAVIGLFAAAILFGVVTEDEIGLRMVALLPALVPLALLSAAVIRAATRATVLSVRGGRVTLFSGAALLRPVKSWPADDVESVKVSVRGVSATMRLAADLNLRMRNRTNVLVIAGRARADLEWVAQGLRATLARAAVARVDIP